MDEGGTSTNGSEKEIIMTLHKALHSRDCIDWLYVSRKEKGRELASIEDSVDTSIRRFEIYMKKGLRKTETNKWYLHKPISKWDAQTSLGF